MQPLPTAAPRLQIAAPQPGASVGRSFVLQGVAAGSDRVDVFLEPDRDAGGPLVGSGVPGELSPGLHLNRPIGSSEFFAPATVPKGDHTLYVHAHSARSGQDTIITLTITAS